MNRREVLKATAILTFAALPQFAFGADERRGRLLVILLRGGMDGLTAAPPIGDPALKNLRPNLIPGMLLPLDGFFALHPAMGNLHRLYGKGEVVVIQAASYPYTGRSHFEGQDIMESGLTKPYASASGWLGRAMGIAGFQAVAMSLPMPLILRGPGVVDNNYPSSLVAPPPEAYAKLIPLWSVDPALAGYGAQLGATMTMASAAPGQTDLGVARSLKSLGTDAGKRMALADGPRLAVLDHVGFDTHAGQPAMHADKLREVDEAIDAFRTAIGEAWKDTLVVTVTEFGRTAAENGSAGTDHGWGTCILLAGGRLKKAGVIADWPGLKTASLFEGRDLKATVDARSVYGAIVSRTFGIDPERVRRDVMDFKDEPKLDLFLG